MERIDIIGGSPLKGEVEISGAKNAALPILFASLLCPGASTISRVPDLWDVRTTLTIMEGFGAGITRNGHTVEINAANLDSFKAPYELVKTMRASVLALGPLLARFGQAKVSLPGGCAIGARPVDQHIKALERLGAQLDIHHGYISAKVPRGHLTGGRITFDISTVGGTEQALMAAVLAKGKTVLENCALEPEVVDLANFLQAMGAKIEGAGESVIEIEGVDELKPCKFQVIPDRIEAGTYIAAAAMTGGDVTISNLNRNHMLPVIEKFRDAGVAIDFITHDTARVQCPGELRAVDIVTKPYPGFPTDMQAQMMALLTTARGSSVIRENIFENRFMHVLELVRMGADIKLDGSVAVVTGVERLQGADVMATDLRASASLVIAGLIADGETRIHRVYHLFRGYENMVEKLSLLGANIRRGKDE